MLKKRHGNSKITAAMTTQFKLYLKAGHKDLRKLTKAQLYRAFADPKNPARKWKDGPSKTQFYEFMKGPEFAYVRPSVTPYLNVKHKAARLAWSNKLKTMTKVRFLAFLNRSFFIDGAYFSNKFTGGYGSDKVKVLVTRKNKKRPTYAQLPQTKAYQVYQGLNKYFSTGTFLVNEHNSKGNSAVTSDIVEEFLKSEIAPVAVKLRAKLGLEPTATLYLV